MPTTLEHLVTLNSALQPHHMHVGSNIILDATLSPRLAGSMELFYQLCWTWHHIWNGLLDWKWMLSMRVCVHVMHCDGVAIVTGEHHTIVIINNML